MRPAKCSIAHWSCGFPDRVRRLAAGVVELEADEMIGSGPGAAKLEAAIEAVLGPQV